ncbi:protein TolQ [Blochmannia endosymbiont of Camponotus modoc]|uniref:protein TolQ n=1 Tax=Blochmannia endosymbiont of Camponotus modoc TaxID=2945587 RepID=UPI002023F588|nr:protein TolQ [Blochmannia endosymbiont of Camponotus modoc]URJ29123.1 protein TolQ [Blochmannia endosymbiont of Camponotus modoc]
MNIFNLFLEINILVQISIFVLIGFSVLSWSIIFHRIFVLSAAQRKLKVFENEFWSGIDLSSLYQKAAARRNKLNGVEQIFYVGFKEFSKLYQTKHCSPETMMSRTLDNMHTAINIELKSLEDYIPLIGTIGSISPYLGLFGTVLGIIHVFIELGKTTTNNVANQMIHIQIIAPGIAESLISTAIGLFVAIPAVIAFNYLTAQINNMDQDYNNFIEEFITILYHQIFFNIDSAFNKENQYEEKAYQKHD